MPIEIGKYQTLEILRDTDYGLFLGDDEGNDVLLPNKYVPENVVVGDDIEVFVYLDHSERPVATTLTPKMILGEIGYLEVVSVTELGAFLDWGLEKHLFVPFKEQSPKMQEGNFYWVYMYLDERTGRLIGSARLELFLRNRNVKLRVKEEVDIYVLKPNKIGYDVLINDRYLGMIFNTDAPERLRIGDQRKAYIKQVREDGKVDVTLQVWGRQKDEPNAQLLLDKLKSGGGILPVSDKSDPEKVLQYTGMSKKTFKKAVGNLLKQKLIRVEQHRIILNK
ncbi:CvfB family protein [Sediminitomix flava]|uniref:GntR family transcriptional regulator n=1 Tax=Sediminitomix flava TaxID=379075 RepID=A0A315ZFB3_SEDFL|nr:S1-like domain-containing RNA-binding protein [Sediminitomix flava]PWJ43850.1 hypothetical protein BC781_101196 [Sediminitomix flava]